MKPFDASTWDRCPSRMLSNRTLKADKHSSDAVYETSAKEPQSSSMKLRTLILLGILLAACARQRASQVPVVHLGGVGTLVVVITDSAGTPRAANAYLAEDPRLASGAVTYGTAGVWADEKEGVARLGTWRPGKYTLVVRRIGTTWRRDP